MCACGGGGGGGDICFSVKKKTKKHFIAELYKTD